MSLQRNGHFLQNDRKNKALLDRFRHFKMTVKAVTKMFAENQNHKRGFRSAGLFLFIYLFACLFACDLATLRLLFACFRPSFPLSFPPPFFPSFFGFIVLPLSRPASLRKKLAVGKIIAGSAKNAGSTKNPHGCMIFFGPDYSFERTKNPQRDKYTCSK